MIGENNYEQILIREHEYSVWNFLNLSYVYDIDNIFIIKTTTLTKKLNRDTIEILVIHILPMILTLAAFLPSIQKPIR